MNGLVGVGAYPFGDQGCQQRDHASMGQTRARNLFVSANLGSNRACAFRDEIRMTR
jgi:hypothetical protein